jgi:hypothetical protein
MAGIRKATLAMSSSPPTIANLLTRKMLLERDFSIEDRSDELLRLKHTRAGADFEFDASASQGYNIVRAYERQVGEDGILYEATYTGNWARAGLVWYLQELTEEERENGKTVRRFVFAFDAFEPNIAVSEDEFRWKQLDLCATGVIVDQRVTAPVRAYKNSPKASDAEKPLDTLIERVRSLPPLPPASAPEVPEPAAERRIWIIGLGLLGAGLLAAAGFLRWRSRRGQ